MAGGSLDGVDEIGLDFFTSITICVTYLIIDIMIVYEIANIIIIYISIYFIICAIHAAVS
jgi:hypothetical protein